MPLYVICALPCPPHPPRSSAPSPLEKAWFVRCFFVGALFSVGHPELVELLDEGALRIHPKARGNAPKGSTKRFCYPIFLKVTIDRTF